MESLIKLTNARGRTYGGMQWGEGVGHVIPQEERSGVLCNPGILHAYRSEGQALLMAKGHIGWAIEDTRMWNARTLAVVADDGTKVGTWDLETTMERPFPAWWNEPETLLRIRVLFAGLVAEAVLGIYEDYSPGDLRPRQAVELALKMARSGKFDAAAAYTANAANAAYAAAYTANAAYAAYAAANAANAAADAVVAAGRAAANAYAKGQLDVAGLAKRAVTEIAGGIAG